MDITTLAAAKAYTDKKVAEGGGSGGGGLPVVEISSADSFTDAEQAQLTALAEQGMPIIVKVVTDGVVMITGVFAYAFYGETDTYHAFVGSGIAAFISTADGTWTASWE